jgi:isoleucyl-tRNA synthetase
VHLTDWPAADELPADPELVVAMDEVRDVCSVASSVRKANKLRVRLPLHTLTVAGQGAEKLRPFASIIADEVNVREVQLSDDAEAYGRIELAVNARAAGPRLGKQVQTVIKAVKAGDWSVVDGVVSAAGIALEEGEYTRKLVAASPDSTAELSDGAGLVVLDLSVDEELQAEGWAKDRVRELQEARRAAGLDVTDRITLVLQVPTEKLNWATRHRALIADEVLATSLELVVLPVGDEAVAAGFVDVGDGARVKLARA